MKKILPYLAVTFFAFGCSGVKSVSDSYELPLPKGCVTPDGMALGADGNVYLSINQLSGNFKNRAKIVRITKSEKFEDVVVLPALAESGIASPMGIAFDDDGNLYVADNQLFGGKAGKSRILRVKFKDGKVVSCGAVVENLGVANGLAFANGRLYLTDCMVDTSKNPLVSAVYVFETSKLDESNPVKIKGLSDSHVFDVFQTRYEFDYQQVGCDGIVADKGGNIYIANFGEASVTKYELMRDGKIYSKTVLFKGGLLSCDGLRFDAEGNLWIADFAGNAVAIFDFKSDKPRVVKQSPTPSDGAFGSLNAPAEVILRNGKVYISNMNVNMSPHKSSNRHSMTVLKVK